MMAQQVLVVEDDPTLRQMYERVLSKLGWQILQAKDGEQAQQLLAENHPSLVFLDMLLPHVNGVQVLQFIASQPHLAQTHVVVVSSSQEYQQHIGIVNSSQFMLKPILPSKILEVTTHYMQTMRG